MMRRDSIRHKRISGIKINSSSRRIFRIVNLFQIRTKSSVTLNMPKKAKLCELVSEPKVDRIVRPEVREAYIKNFEERKDLFKKLAKY
ncbi:MAG: hypothetical protein GYA60_00980 [Candidatus Methanofastidiosa archaeon]|nr:hypothetical protein [Candidatus Methanofastidiosa archaeon]